MKNVRILAIGRLGVLLSLAWLSLPCSASTSSSLKTGVSYKNGLLFPLTASGQHSPFIFEPAVAGSSDSLGEIVWGRSASSTGTIILHLAIHARTGKLNCSATRLNSIGNTATIIYTVPGEMPVQITVNIAINSASLSVTLDANQPVITSVDFGSFPSTLAIQKIAVPYYTGNVWYSGALQSFVNAWWDVSETHGTLFSGSQVQYGARSDGTLVPMHEKLIIAISPNVDDVFPSLPGPASPYMSELAGRTVLDIWTSGFSAIRDGLQTLGDYGITDCIGIIHNWQHAGYDNGLPQHYPANEKLGGDVELKAAVAAGKADGCLMALHENYIDYYPNYSGFNQAAVATKGDRQRMLAWKNGSGIQSFQAKPSWMVKNASTQSPIIHRLYGTNASFIDVNSAVAPYFKRDMDPSVPYGGTLQAWMKGAADLWTYERKVYGGPVFGEGLYHWYYSGMLDGVEAQLGAGVPMREGGNLPLFVDFDLLRIHPLQVNHGMGYYERWTSAGTRSMTPSDFDAYRAQEIAFGHAPFLGTPYWNDIRQALVESGLVAPVAKRYGDEKVTSIQYFVNDIWTTPSLAAQAGRFDRVSIKYTNGLQVAVNANAAVLQWNSLALPKYGWGAKGKDILAYTALCDDTICDYAQTTTSIFANARNTQDAIDYAGLARPLVASVKSGRPHSFSITYNWSLHQKLTDNYKIFVHFVDDKKLSSNAGIAFQEDHSPQTPSSQWPTDKSISDGPYQVSIPGSVPDGRYSIRIGLLDPATGARIPLVGKNDGTGRYILGYIVVAEHGANVSFAPATQFITGQDSRLNATGKVLNFHSVQTDGMVSIRQENGQWVLRPFPTNRNFTVRLNSRVFSMPTQIKSPGGSTSSVTSKEGPSGWWTLVLNGAKYYSWASDGTALTFQ